MRFAFPIVSLFPGGGLQRDCVDITRRLQDLGHEVVLFTSRVSNRDFFSDLTVRVLPVEARTNHQRQRAFSDAFGKTIARGGYDLIVGFDKIAGLDLLYCSDRSIYPRITKNPLLRILPRYSEFLSLEETCFAQHRKTRILLLSESQLSEYWKAWLTDPKRLALLPPTILRSRRHPEFRTNSVRQEWRSKLGLSDDDWAWVAIGVQPRTKGADRTIAALRYFPSARLMIVGLNKDDNRSREIVRLADKLGVSKQIVWLGHRENIPQLMACADLFVHPARYDTTGTVILEAIIN